MPSVISFCCNNAERDEIVDKILDRAKGTKHLKNLSQNFSCEGGFELPLTLDWQEKIENTPNACFLQYHSARQLRFVMDGEKLTGLRLKDNIPYWSSEELCELSVLLSSIV